VPKMLVGIRGRGSQRGLFLEEWNGREAGERLYAVGRKKNRSKW